MSMYDVLLPYGASALLKVSGLVVVVFVLRLAVLPFAVVTVVLDRSQRYLSVLAASIPVAQPASARSGGGKQ